MAHILLIDDEELALFTLREILEGAGHTVETAGNGEDGLALQEARTFSMIITDMIMPRVEGTQTIRTIRDRNPDLPIVAMSGGGRTRNTDLLEIAKQCGVNAVLTKPFSEEELLCVVNAFLTADKQ